MAPWRRSRTISIFNVVRQEDSFQNNLMKKCSESIKINHISGRHIINPIPPPPGMLRFAYALTVLNYRFELSVAWKPIILMQSIPCNRSLNIIIQAQ